VAFGRRIATATITGAGLRPSWLPPVWRLPSRPRPLAHGVLALRLLALLVLLVRTRVLVTGPDGTEVQRRVFEPFGKMIASSTPTEPTAQLFTGHRFEAQSALYDFGARWYDPDTGRFLSVDPIVQALGDPQTHNAYGFVRNNPLSNVDADGMGLFQWLGRLSAKGWWGHALSILIGVVVGVVIGGIVGGVVLGGINGAWVGAALGGELALPEGAGVGALVGATVGDSVVQAGAGQASAEEGGVGSAPIFSGAPIGDLAMHWNTPQRTLPNQRIPEIESGDEKGWDAALEWTRDRWNDLKYVWYDRKLNRKIEQLKRKVARDSRFRLKDVYVFKQFHYVSVEDSESLNSADLSDPIVREIGQSPPSPSYIENRGDAGYVEPVGPIDITPPRIMAVP